VDDKGEGHVVDVNPRVTGSAPAILIAQLVYENYGFEYGLFRRTSRSTFAGTADELVLRVQQYNDIHSGHSLVVLVSFCQVAPDHTIVNIAVYGSTSLEELEVVLNNFAPIRKREGASAAVVENATSAIVKYPTRALSENL
jgi:hypothetical protein